MLTNTEPAHHLSKSPTSEVIWGRRRHYKTPNKMRFATKSCLWDKEGDNESQSTLVDSPKMLGKERPNLHITEVESKSPTPNIYGETAILLTDGDIIRRRIKSDMQQELKFLEALDKQHRTCIGICRRLRKYLGRTATL
jgi:hypothetical protein